MKKIISLFVFLLMTAVYAQSGQVIITTVVDGTCSSATPRMVELYVSGTVDFTGYKLQLQYNSNTDWTGNIDLSALGTLTDTYAYVYNDGSENNFTTEFPSAAGYPSIESGTVSFNGDDRVRVVDANDNVLDMFGEDGVDGSGTAWEYLDSWAKRQSGQGPNPTFDVNEWDFGGPNALDNKCSASDGTTLEDDMGGIQTYLGVTGQSIQGLQVYPNPVMSGEYVRIQSDEQIDNVQVFDLLGNLVRESSVTDGLLDQRPEQRHLYAQTAFGRRSSSHFEIGGSISRLFYTNQSAAFPLREGGFLYSAALIYCFMQVFISRVVW